MKTLFAATVAVLAIASAVPAFARDDHPMVHRRLIVHHRVCSVVHHHRVCR